MAATLSTAINSATTDSPIPLRAPQCMEIWTVTGSTSVAGDTGTITPKFITSIDAVVGGTFARSVSGSTITLTDKAGIGSGVVDIQVIGRQ